MLHDGGVATLMALWELARTGTARDIRPIVDATAAADERSPIATAAQDAMAAIRSRTGDKMVGGVSVVESTPQGALTQAASTRGQLSQS